MAYSKMSLGIAIFTALLSISFVTGTAGFQTLDIYAENAAHRLADVARTCQFETAIGLSNPEWCTDGMRIFAYSKTLYFWSKKRITWALGDNPTVITKEFVETNLKAAFAKWTAASQIVFADAHPQSLRRPDIRIWFTPETMALPSGEGTTQMSGTIFPKKARLDGREVILHFVDSDVWTNTDRQDWSNFQFVALYEIGRILGLGNSNVDDAVMRGEQNPGYHARDEPELADDDIDGVRDKYKLPPRNESGSSSRSSTRQ